MEVQLLHPQKKSRKWRPSLKKLFQRKKKLPEGDLKYFAAVDKFDPSEQDQTSTVNLSTASESNGGTSSSRLYSGDEHSSDDSASMGPQSRGGHRQPELRRRSSTPVRVPMTHKLSTGAPVVAEEHYTYSQSLTEDFAQLDVPSMEVHRTSSLWRKNKKPFVYKRNARSLDIPRNNNCDGEYFDKESPIFSDAEEEEGMEVVLFESASGSDNENDNGHETSSQSFEEGIFLSLQAPLHRSTTSKSQPEQQQQQQETQQQEDLNRTVSLSADSDMVALRRQPSPSAAFYATDENSPTLSKDVTWVSHDESSEDDRPVKEIVFPTLTGDSLEPLEEEMLEGGARGGLLDPDFAAIEVDVALSRSREEVRDAIFASLEEEEEEIIFDHRRFDDDFDSLSLEDFDPQPGETETSPKTSPKPTEDTKTKLWDSGVVMDTIALLAPSAEEPLERPLSSSPRRKAHSTAFIKRQSAFSGQDLLSEEAECFAEFLEESCDDLSAIQANPHDIFSPDRFLSAINASMMDDDGFPSLINSENGVIGPAAAERPPSAQNETNTSLDRSLGGGSASDMYTKSLSYDTSSLSQGASFPSYSSKGPSINGPNDVYCGARIFPREEDDDDDDDDVYDDDFTEDSFSSHPSDKIHKPRRGRKNRHSTTSLEDIRLDVLEAVQDIARSASNNMFKFLQD